MKKFAALFMFMLVFASSAWCGPESWPKPWLSNVTLTIGPLNPYSDLYHATWDGGNGEKYAVDLLGPMNTELRAPVSGRIVCCNMYPETTISTSCANGHGGYGNHVIIEPDGDPNNTFIMAHLSDLSRQLPLFDKSGNNYRINFGDAVGFLGSTGNSTAPHLHFELRSRFKTERDSIRLFGITESQFRNRASLAGSLRDADGQINITTNSLPNWKQGDGDYNERIYYEGGTATSARIYSGSLPDGLIITCVNAQVHIEGTPTKNDTYTFTVKIEDGSKSGEKSYTVNISGITPHPTDIINITTNSLEDGKVNDKGKWTIYYYYQGSPAKECEVISGNLPNGLNTTCVNGEAHIEGTPTQSGTFTFTIRLKNDSASDTKTYNLTISEPNFWLRLTTDSLPDGKVGDTYKQQFYYDYKGEMPTGWEISSGSLPEGLTITCVNGQVHIEGTPEKDGTFSFTLRIKNSAASDEKAYTVNIYPKPDEPDYISITTNSMADGEINKSYKQPIYYNYKGDIAKYCEIISGNLPDGLNTTCVNGQAHIEGTPTQSGTFSFTVRVRNDSVSDEKDYILKIAYTDNTPDTPVPSAISDWELVGNELVVNQIYRYTQLSGVEDKYFMMENLPIGFTVNIPENWVIDTDGRGVTVKGSTNISSLADGLGIRVSGPCTITVNYDNMITFTARQIQNLDSWELVGNELIVGGYRFTQNISGNDKFFKLSGLPNATVIHPAANWVIDTDGRGVTVQGSTSTTPLDDGLGIRVTGPCSIMKNYVGVEFTARQVDTQAPSKSRDVAGSVTITTKSPLKYGRDTKQITRSLKLSGADSAVWSIVDGELPEGLTLNSATGQITGKLEEWAEEPFEFTVRADTINGSAEKTFTLEVRPVKPRIKGTLPKGQANEEYTGVITAIGSKPMDWSVENLPEDFDYEISEEGDTCTITGYPEEEYKGRIRVTVTNAAGSASKNVRLIIKPVMPEICADDMPNGIVGTYYEAELDSPGSPKWYWSGRVPPGLTIDKLTGKISGTPTMSGTFTFKVKAKNPSGIDYEDFTIIISEGRNYHSRSEENGVDYHPETKNEAEQSTLTSNEQSSKGNDDHEANNYEVKIIPVIPDDYFIVAVLSEDFTVDEDGQHDFDVTLDESIPSGIKLYYFAQSSEPSDDDEIVDFCDTSGEYIDEVPEDRAVTVSPWFRVGVIYNPVIAVKAEDCK